MSVATRPSSPVLAAVSALLTLGASSASAQGLKLNGPLARPVGGDIRSARLLPSGAALVYVADQEVDERFDLYVVDARAAAPVPLRLNAAIGFGDVQPDFEVTPDELSVVYLADQEVNNVDELYVARLDGGAPPRKLNAPLVTGGDVRSGFRIAPSGTHVVYVADQDTNERFELYSVALDGASPPVKLSDPSVTGLGSVASFVIGPRSRRVVFQVGTQEVLFSAALEGTGDPVRLLDRSFGDPLVSADGRSVFAWSGTGGATALYAIPTLGGTPVSLATNPLGATFGVRFASAANDSRIVFVAGTSSVLELFSVPTDGSAPPLRISAPLAAGASVSAGFLRVSPAGSRVLYLVQTSTGAELYSATVDGSAPAVRLNDPLPLYARVDPRSDGEGVEISADSSRVLYRADQLTRGRYELFSVPIAGGTPVRLNGALPDGGNVFEFDITADSRRVVYVADQDARQLFELFVAPIDGAAPAVQVSAPLEPEGDIAEMFANAVPDPLLLTPDSSSVIYLADQEVPDAVELFRAPLDGSLASTRLNEILAQGPIEGDVVRAQFAGGEHVVYVADQDENDVFELYGVSAHDRGRPVKLSGDMVEGGDVWYYRFTVSPDGRRVVYTADQETNDVLELYSAPVDGSAPAVKLSGASPGAGDVYYFVVDPTGQRVVYSSDAAVEDVYEVFSVPIDGSAPPVRLSAPMVAGGSAYSFQVSPNGKRVTYVADQEVDERYELYSVSIDGNAPPRKLNAALPAGGRVLIAEIGPQSRQVVYSARQDAADRADVYAVRIRGGGAPVRLSGPTPSGATVRDIVISPDGRRVAYAADFGSVWPLFVAPSDGRVAAQQISAAGEVVAGGFGRVQFTSDGQRVVYVAWFSGFLSLFSARSDGSGGHVQLSAAGHYLEGNYENWILVSSGGRAVYTAQASGSTGIFGVPVDGSATPVRLDGGRRVSSAEFQLAPGGNEVLFLQEGASGFLELALAPIDGSAPAKVVASDSERHVSEYATSPSGDRIAFLLGQASDDIVELFLRFLDRPLVGASVPPQVVERQF